MCGIERIVSANGVAATRVHNANGGIPARVRSANGAASSQPGATPLVHVRQMEQGPTARSITGGVDSSRGVAARGWDGLSALGFVLAFVPGALPQAGMGAHLWCWGTGPARDLEQTIADSLPLSLGEDRG